MNLKPLTAAVLASTLAFSAGATSTDWEGHGDTEIGVGLVPQGQFEDTFSFSLDISGMLEAAAVANNLNGTFDITDGTVSLFKATAPGDDVAGVLVGSFSFDGSTGSITHQFTSLDAGDYFYSVTGTANGNAGGFYSLSSTVAAVPEPDTLALLAGGMLCVAGLYRRRGAHKA